MKKNYRKPVMKLHNVKVSTAMMDVSNPDLDISDTGVDDGWTKERNAGDWEEF